MVDFLKIHYGCNRSRMSLNLIPSSYPYPSIFSAPLPLRAELHEVVVKIFPYEMGTLHFKTLASLAAMLHSKLKIAELAGWLTVNSEVTHFSWGLPHPLPHSSVTFRKLI